LEIILSAATKFGILFAQSMANAHFAILTKISAPEINGTRALSFDRKAAQVKGGICHEESILGMLS
jgi:hypothetical protein